MGSYCVVREGLWVVHLYPQPLTQYDPVPGVTLRLIGRSQVFCDHVTGTPVRWQQLHVPPDEAFR